MTAPEVTTPTSTIRVEIYTECEAYPVLAISDAPLSEWAYEIPRPLWEAMCDAQRALDAAEAEIMRYVGNRHPEAHNVRAWVREYNEDAGGDS